MMPQMGESLTEGTLVRWLKQVGDAVAQDEPLFEISTDKVDTDVPSPVAGSLHEQIVREGQTVSIGRPVALVSTVVPDATATADASTPPTAPKAHEEPSGHFKSSHATQLVSFARGRGDQHATRPAAGSTNPTGTAAPPPAHRRPVAEVKAHRTSLSTGPWSPATLDAARRGGVSLEVLTALGGVQAVADASPSATSNGICKAAPPRERPFSLFSADRIDIIDRAAGRVQCTAQPPTTGSSRCRLCAAGLPTI